MTNEDGFLEEGDSIDEDIFDFEFDDLPEGDIEGTSKDSASEDEVIELVDVVEEGDVLGDLDVGPELGDFTLAMNEDDYAGYTQHFDKVMKSAVTEAVFSQSNSLIKARIGDYVSKAFWKVETEGAYTLVYYKAAFTQEPEDVVVKVVFQEVEGEIYVSGLWFDSPKLRQK